MFQRLFVLVWALTAACAAQTSIQPVPQSQPKAQNSQPAASSPGSQSSQPAPQGSAATPNPQPALKPPVAPPPPPDSAATVPPAQPVITVKGVCAATPAKRPAGIASKTPATSCETVLTKADFEKLVHALNSSNQTIPPAMRRNLAQAYVELLTFSQAARKAGVEKDPRFLEIMKLMRMRTLADLYRRDLEEKYRTPPQQEIDAYYNQNLPKYEEIKLSRVFIPAKNTSATDKDDWEKKAAQAANDIHDRAAKGEDLEKLQKEAYTTLGLTINPPNTAVGSRRRGMMAPAEEQELFALKAGDVSKVEQEPAGYIIYKLESKQKLPLTQVKDEISRELFRQRMESGMKSVTGAVKAEYNDQYFGPPAAPVSPMGVPPGGRPPRGAIGANVEDRPAPPGAPAGKPDSSPPPSAPAPASPSSSPAPPAQKPPR